MLADARALVALTRWLGPWASPESVPKNIRLERAEIESNGRRFEAWLFHPRRTPAARYVVAPGLHFDGPADPRMRRFCTILARAGFEVLAPFLPDFVHLRVTPRVIDDFEAAFAHLASRRPGPIGVFSISFGSLPALRLAANSRWADRLSHLVCFGGYADFHGAMEYALAGEGRDPLNQAAVFINLIDELDGVRNPEVLVDGWMQYMRRTWGRPEMKVRRRWEPVAREVAETIPASARSLFLVGCGAEPGALDHARAAFARRGAATAFTDPRPHLAGITCKVYLVHGRDDDVIPYTQAELLRAAMPPAARAEVLLTGLYDHTRPASDGSIGDRARLMVKEAASMARILGAIARGGR